MNLNQITQNVVRNAVKSEISRRVQSQVKEEAIKTARSIFKIWLTQNRTKLNDDIGRLVKQQIDAQYHNVVRQAAKRVRLTTRNYY